MKQDIYPIYAYGNSILRKKASLVAKEENITQVIQRMFQTMSLANGVGLAAPQVGISKRLFIIDTSSFLASDRNIEQTSVTKQIFINPEILKEDGKEWKYKEGCLSIPDIQEEVLRKERVTIQYMDENFEEHTKIYDGVEARVIQHEYDHIEGILFIDHISAIKKSLLKKRLDKIMKGKIDTDYPMVFI